jgi:hypothetical protein
MICWVTFVEIYFGLNISLKLITNPVILSLTVYIWVYFPFPNIFPSFTDLFLLEYYCDIFCDYSGYFSAILKLNWLIVKSVSSEENYSQFCNFLMIDLAPLNREDYLFLISFLWRILSPKWTFYYKKITVFLLILVKFNLLFMVWFRLT